MKFIHVFCALSLLLLGDFTSSLNAQLDINLEGPSFCTNGVDAPSPTLYSFDYTPGDGGTATCTEVTWEVAGGIIVDDEGLAFPNPHYVTDCNGGGIIIEDFLSINVIWDDSAPVQEIKVKVKNKVKVKIKLLFFSITINQIREGEDKIIYKKVLPPESLDPGPSGCGTRLITAIMPPLDDCRQPDRLLWSVNGSFFGFGPSRTVSTSNTHSTLVEVAGQYGNSISAPITLVVPADVQIAANISGPNSIEVSGLYDYSLSNNADQIVWSVSTPHATITPVGGSGARLNYFAQPVVEGIITISAELTKCGQTTTRDLDVAVGPCVTEPCGPLLDAPNVDDLQHASKTLEINSVGKSQNIYTPVSLLITNPEYSFLPEEEQSISVYPNPLVRGNLLMVKGVDSSKNYSLFDANGRVVLFGLFREYDTSINTVNLANGVYFLKVFDEEGKMKHTKKVIIN